MHTASSDQHRRMVAALVAAAAKLPKALRSTLPIALRGPKLPPFLRAYYANVETEDLAGRDPKELATIALSQLNLARRRRGRALVRVFNPTQREDGYTSAHTVIEMVNDDMPFLVDSIGLALTQRALALHFLAHPIFAVTRDSAGDLQSIEERGVSADGKKPRLESFQHIEIDRIVDSDVLRSLQMEIERGMSDVRVACADWAKMQTAARHAADDLNSLSARFDPRDVSESQALLAWMQNRHFTFLGYREYRLRGATGRESLEPVDASGLGLLRPGRKHPSSAGRILASDIRRQSRSRELALVTKANFHSTVHRPGYIDYIGIKHFGPTGRLIGERRFLGLWFQASVPELIKVVTGIFGLQERPRVRLLMRRDAFRRFYSCLVFVPREKYNTVVRQRIERVVGEAFNALSMESQVQIAESNLARIHIVARTLPVEHQRVDIDALELRIAAAVRSWADSFKSALLARFDEAYALQLYAAYAQAFPAAYTEDFSGDAAALDVTFLEAVDKEPKRLHLDIYRPEPRRKETFFLKIFRGQDAIPISDLLPKLEHMGLKVIAERPYALEFAGGRRAWIQDLELVMRAPTAIKLDQLDRELKSAFTAVWTGRMDSDSFNELTLTTGVPWRIVTVLRAYCRYLLQAGLPFSQGYIAQVLINNTTLARAFADLFVARFDPRLSAARRRSTLARLDQRIRARLEEVTGSDEDRILRAIWNTLTASVRTNAYQTTESGQFKDYLSFKMESQKLRELPLPKPLFEVFVFSTRMEGVHLRMGYVARGGIRWSDRREDFRTEILGLMKAQQVKNTVIVPVGAKGGFVVKRILTGDRETQQAEVIECYQTLIRGLLDITDNIVDDKIVAPADVVRHDGDDAYLVVAADKGTATFSDIANSISAEYGFWLGDAFASGGSAGYDHKKMAITARGAWECVKRHFREIGIDIQNQDFSAAGIGDMAGDVFGNRSNDSVRIDARELNCKVIGEGGNLGFSQLGRIEYARRGGRLNTDFIDNSAGVNCSDVEVNLKILLNGAVRAKEITRAARDRLLVQMTSEVASLVLRNNYLQSQAISTGEFQAKERLSESAYVIRALERSGDLNRSLEFLPSDEEIAERRKAGEGLTRPELAVTLSYGKIWLYKALIHSDVPEDPYLSAELARYFPAPVKQRFAARLKRHRLRREIIATSITNSLINRMGPVFPVRAQEDTGAEPAAIARAYSIAREVFAVRDIWTQIEALDNSSPAAVQYTAMFQTTRLLRHASYWLLENRRNDLDIERAVRRYAAPVAALSRNLGDVLSATEQARLRVLRSRLIEQRVPEELATRIASLESLHCSLDLVEAAMASRLEIGIAARAYFDIGERIGLTWIKDQIETLPAEGHWQAVARGTLSDNLYELQRKITGAVLTCKGKEPGARVDRWLQDHSAAVESLKRIVVDLRTGTAPDFATLSVALQAVRRLVQDGVHAG